MKFARNVFLIAGLWGLMLLIPLYFASDLVSRSYPPPITHPDFYYGFVSVALVWQVAFLIIATDPARHRPIMLAAMLEKFIYVGTIGTLYLKGQLQLGQFAVISPDFILALLFMASFIKTAEQR